MEVVPGIKGNIIQTDLNQSSDISRMSMSTTTVNNECGRCKTPFEEGSIYCCECGFKVDKRRSRVVKSKLEQPQIVNETYSIPIKQGFIQDTRSLSPMRKSSSEKIRLDARKRVAERKPPSSNPTDNILKNADKKLYEGKKKLIGSKKARSKQERVIEFLEESNLKKIMDQLPPKERNYVDLGKIANRTSIADVKSQFPDYEKFMNPLSYTEWHLKTVHGIHKEAERIYPLCSDEEEVEEEFAHTRWSTPQSRQNPSTVTIKSMCPILVAPGTPLTGPQSIPNHLTVPNADVTYGFPLLNGRL